jgi:glycolate oxidase iron-sulfur subunit
VALLTGCLSPVVAPQINGATLRVLARQGVETVVPSAQGCCGAIVMQLDEAPAARRLARQNLRVFPQDVDAILTNSADCGAGIRDYPLLFVGEADWASAEAFAARVLDVCVFLDRLGWEPPGPMLSPPRRVMIHDACYASRAQGVAAAQRRLLAALPNIELVAGCDGDLSCGAAGAYNLLQPEIARQLGDRQAAGIAASAADAVVTGSISCLLQLQAHLRRQARNLPVYHPLTLLDQACEGTGGVVCSLEPSS